jgi:hypothetical protein
VYILGHLWFFLQIDVPLHDFIKKTFQANVRFFPAILFGKAESIIFNLHTAKNSWKTFKLQKILTNPEIIQKFLKFAWIPEIPEYFYDSWIFLRWSLWNFPKTPACEFLSNINPCLIKNGWTKLHFVWQGSNSNFSSKKILIFQEFGPNYKIFHLKSFYFSKIQTKLGDFPLRKYSFSGINI